MGPIEHIKPSSTAWQAVLESIYEYLKWFNSVKAVTLCTVQTNLRRDTFQPGRGFIRGRDFSLKLNEKEKSFNGEGRWNLSSKGKKKWKERKVILGFSRCGWKLWWIVFFIERDRRIKKERGERERRRKRLNASLCLTRSSSPVFPPSPLLLFLAPNSLSLLFSASVSPLIFTPLH